MLSNDYSHQIFFDMFNTILSYFIYYIMHMYFFLIKILLVVCTYTSK